MRADVLYGGYPKFGGGGLVLHKAKLARGVAVYAYPQETWREKKAFSLKLLLRRPFMSEQVEVSFGEIANDFFKGELRLAVTARHIISSCYGDLSLAEQALGHLVVRHARVHIFNARGKAEFQLWFPRRTPLVAQQVNPPGRETLAQFVTLL